MRRFALLLASLLAAAPIAGSAPPPTRGAAAPPRPLLWKLSDADNSVYLLGSFHLLKTSDYPLSADVTAAFADAERVVFEVDPAALSDPALGMRMAQLAMSPRSAALVEVAPEPLLERLRALLGSMSLPASQLEQFEPWFVSLAVVSSLGQQMGFAAEQGLDRYLMAEAAKAGKPTGGLETIDSQLAALDGTPVAEQLVSLEEYAAEDANLRARLDELHAAWRRADVATLQRLTREDMQAKTPETYRRLNVDRNRAWMPQVRAMLDGNSREDVLVVVGALHLLGPDGLVEQLQSAGYRVERICTGCAPERRARR